MSKIIIIIFLTVLSLFACNDLSDEIKEPDKNKVVHQLIIETPCEIYFENEKINIEQLCPRLMPITCVGKTEAEVIWPEIEIIAEENVEMGCINAIKDELRKCDLLKVKYKIRQKLFD